MEKHICLGLMIPVAFLIFTGMVKSLVKKEWLYSNFYLGMDIALAALANGIVNVVDAAHRVETMAAGTTNDLGNQLFYTSLCIIAAIGALLTTMSLHQRYEVANGQPDNPRLARGIWLGLVSNLIGGAVLTMFIFMKLRKLI